MNVGKYIFAQVIDFIPRYQFDKLVKKYNGDWHAKDLTCYSQLLHLLFGQITACDSIRDICLCLEAHGSSIYHLGIRKSVNQSNLCRANEKRDYRVYEGLGMYLIGIVRPMYSNTKVAEITIDNVLYTLDLGDYINKHCPGSMGFGQVQQGRSQDAYPFGSSWKHSCQYSYHRWKMA